MLGVISMFGLTYGLKPYFLNGLQAWTTPKLDFLGMFRKIYLFVQDSTPLGIFTTHLFQNWDISISSNID